MDIKQRFVASLASAVDRAIQTLKAFEADKNEYSLTELCKCFKLNKSTAHGILNTLCRYQFLLRDEKMVNVAWGANPDAIIQASADISKQLGWIDYDSPPD